MVWTLGHGSPGQALPLFPVGGGGSAALFRSRPPLSVPWLPTVRAGEDRSCAPALELSRPREGQAGPILALPLIRKGRADSLTIHSVLDKCK